MISRVIIDTGPLVALLDRNDRFHEWAKDQVAQVRPPILTCEAVLAETCYLVRKFPPAVQQVLKWLQRGLLKSQFRLEHEAQRVAELMGKYADLPMSLADASLVRMVELHAQSAVLTLDNDFRVYRQHGRRTIPTMMPDDL